MFLSVIILADRRDSYLKRCLDSIIASLKYHNERDQVEIILISSGLSEEFKGFINCMDSEIRENIKYFEVDVCEKSVLRNRAIKNAKGEIVYFVDDDITVKEDFIAKIIKKFNEYPQTAAIGGPNLTPEDSTLFERTQGYILSSSWGASKMSKRYRLDKEDIQADQSMLILCNLGFRKEILVKENLSFDMRLNYNEENDLLKKLENRGYDMVFSSDISVYHYRRKTIGRYCRQVFESGCGRAKSIKMDNANFSLLYILPAIFLVYLFTLPFIAKIGLMSLVPLVIYIIINIMASLYVFLSKERNIISLMLVLVLFPVGHLSYGVGLSAGIFTPLRKKI